MAHKLLSSLVTNNIQNLAQCGLADAGGKYGPASKEGGIQLFPDGVLSFSGQIIADSSATPIPMDTSANR